MDKNMTERHFKNIYTTLEQIAKISKNPNVIVTITATIDATNQETIFKNQFPKITSSPDTLCFIRKDAKKI